MNRILATFIVAFLIGAVNDTAAQTTTSPEQTAFYSTMRTAYMAWKDNNNIDAVRQSADQIYTQAVSWKMAAKELPKAAKKELKKVVKLSKQLKKLAAKTGNDEDVRQKIAQIHNAYTNVAAVVGGPSS